MEAEHERDTALARYRNYEIASAAFQIGIVLCSAALITGMLLLAWTAGGVEIFGIVFTLGLFPMRFILASRKGKAKHAWQKRRIVTADSASNLWLTPSGRR